MSTSEPDTITSTSFNFTPAIPPMHEKRCIAGVSSIDDSSFIVIGGSGNGGGNSSCEVYDGNANKWTRLPDDMPGSISGRAAARIDRNIYALDSDFGTKAYSLDTKKWVKKKKMKTHRSRCAAAACNGRIFVFGDICRDLDTAEVYDPLTDTWKDLPNLPRLHGFPAAVTVDDKIYVIGGHVCAALSLVDIFNVTTNQWEKGPDMPIPRHGHAAVAIGKFIVVMGGEDDLNRKLSSTSIYDVTEKRWLNGPSMATARAFHTAAIINKNAVVIAGGICAKGDNCTRTGGFHTDTAEIINFNLNSIASENNESKKSTSSNSTITVPPMHEKRWIAGVSSIDDNSFIVIGGGDREGIHSSSEVYDGNANKWTRLAEDMPKKCPWGCTAAKINRNIYVVGSELGTLAYSLDTKKWVKKKKMKTLRGKCAVATCNGQLFVFGNINNAPGTDTAEVYDPMTDTWKDLPNMPRVNGIPAAVTVDDKIYVIGGFHAGSVFSSVDIFNVTTEQWEKGPDMPSPRHAHAAVTIGKFIVVMGGISDRKLKLSSTLIYDVNEKKWSNGPSVATARAYHIAATINENTVVIAGGICAHGGKYTPTSTAEMITFYFNSTTSENNGTSKSLSSRTKVLENELGVNINGSMRMRIRQMETKLYGSTKEGKLIDRLDTLENDLLG